MLISESKDTRDKILTAALFILTIVIMLLPTRVKSLSDFPPPAKAVVIATDNSELEQYGIVKTGNQGVTLEILSGKFKGIVTESNNILMGKLELDKMFVPGDTALITVDSDENGQFVYANLIDHYRINVEFILLGLFVIMLLLYAGWTGFKAVISFAFTGVCLWKLLLPGFLHGLPPVPLSVGIVILITAAIIFLIGGISRKGLTAFIGSVGGILLTCLFSAIFGNAFHIHGAVKPFSETLLYSGYPHLDLSSIFLSGIFLASSGAVMDIAMDISASMQEVRHHHPEINRIELIKSGLRVGRSVVGTMTTTLLLAYSGSYATMMMVFMAQGTPGLHIVNLTYVSAEILHTLVGSFGLVLTAPMTALIGGLIYDKDYLKNQKN